MEIEHFYIEKGQGEPIILLHGNGENSSYFKAQIEAFSERYHVFAVDTRGHGRTPRGNKPFTIQQFADDLVCFMNMHQIQKAHLLGFSDGGNTAMVFAIQHPARVIRLILNGANMNSSGVKRRIQIPIEIGYRIAKMFSSKSSSAKSNAEMLGLMINDPNVTAEELAKIKSRTLIIAGTKDVIKESHTKAIAEYIPNSQLVFLEGNHFVANNNPVEFNRAVLAFLEE